MPKRVVTVVEATCDYPDCVSPGTNTTTTTEYWVNAIKGRKTAPIQIELCEEHLGSPARDLPLHAQVRSECSLMALLTRRKPVVDTDEKFKNIAVSGPCRDLRHAWMDFGDTILLEEKGQVRHFARSLSCIRCETMRTDEFKISNFALVRVRTRYRYPEGYHIKGGIKVADLRFRMFQNMPMATAEEIRTANEEV